MRRIVIPSLLALASTAHAADYRLAYSKAENLEVFVVHADNAQWFHSDAFGFALRMSLVLTTYSFFVLWNPSDPYPQGSWVFITCYFAHSRRTVFKGNIKSKVEKPVFSLLFVGSLTRFW